jgi:pullulanase/glycogen debranching enzyme
VWLNARVIRWPAADSAGIVGATGGGADRGRYVLYGSVDGQLTVTADATVRGASRRTLLVRDDAALPVDVAARTRHVGRGPTLRVPAGVRRADLAAMLREQLLIAYEDSAGHVLDATYTQPALALDALYAAAAMPLPLGARPGTRRTAFRLWAPTAQQVALCLAGDDHTDGRLVPLQRDAASGVWHTAAAAPHGTRYHFLVDVFVPGVGMVRNRVTDPYALGLTANSADAVVTDLSHPDVTPRGWRSRRRPAPAPHATDQVIYELHVRDFSVGDLAVPAAHRGTYLAFTDTAGHGMRHLRRLARAGLTDVHLLPVFDIATIPEVGCRTPEVSGPPAGEDQQAVVVANAAADCYNWGYDPLHYTVPEGSYATTAGDPGARIREFRRMVLALNAVGLRAGMDVVYNHTSAAGQSPQSVLDRIVPGYYQRLDANGRVETSTCCANTATEHRMMAKLMIESVITWVTEYGISSFRFDLMGHQPRAVMEQLQRAVNRAAGHRVPLIGEGWNFGEVADGRRFVQASQRSLGGSGIATFSDRARDAIRGGSALDEGANQVRHQGWVNGLAYAPNAMRRTPAAAREDSVALRAAADMVRVGLAGTLGDYVLHTVDDRRTPLRQIAYNGQPAGYAKQPGEVVNYVENHENSTLFDIDVLRLPAGTTIEDRARVQLLASALVLFSQGIAYVHAGQELLRSKSLDRNSFDSGDWFNSYDPTGARHGFGRGLPPQRDNGSVWEYMRAPLSDPALIPPAALVQWSRDAFADVLRIRAGTALFRLRSAAEVSRRLHFLNTGPAQIPTVVAAHLDGRGHTGRALPAYGFADLVYAVNADTVAHEIPVPRLHGRSLTLHPVMRAATAADRRARESRWDADRGVLLVPARTAVVWVND